MSPAMGSAGVRLGRLTSRFHQKELLLGGPSTASETEGKRKIKNKMKTTLSAFLERRIN